MKQYASLVLICMSILPFNSVIGQNLIRKQFKPCDMIYEKELYRRRIVSCEQTKDTFHVTVAYTSNCCQHPIASLNTTKDTLFLKPDPDDDTYCACDCYSEHRFSIPGKTDTNLIVFYDGVLRKDRKYIDLPPLNFPDTGMCNQVDSLGRKIGYWQLFTENDHCYYGDAFYGIAENGSSIALWVKSVDEKGEFQRMQIMYSDMTFIGIDPYYYSFDKKEYLKMLKENEQY